MLEDLEINSSIHHSGYLNKKVAPLSLMLIAMNIDHILSLSETEPDFLSLFGETEDDIGNWHHIAKFRIEDILIIASKEVTERRAATQTGFRRLSYPSFNGDILSYLEFRKRRTVEVIPERNIY